MFYVSLFHLNFFLEERETMTKWTKWAITFALSTASPTGLTLISCSINIHWINENKGVACVDVGKSSMMWLWLTPNSQCGTASYAGVVFFSFLYPKATITYKYINTTTEVPFITSDQVTYCFQLKGILSSYLFFFRFYFSGKIWDFQ